VKDYPCHAIIKELNKGQELRPGMPIRLQVSGGIRDIPQSPRLQTPNMLKTKQVNKSVSISGPGTVLIVQSPEENAIPTRFLVIRWVWSSLQNVIRGHHDFDTEAAVYEAGPTVRCECLVDKKGVRIVKAYFYNAIMDELLNKFPAADAPWLAASMMPRRAPAAIRVDAHDLQLWMDLFS
jgi:hypothetical protein